jgi:F-type H+-transporting ATPase subunit a
MGPGAGAYTVTSQLIVTGTFAVLVYLLSVYVGFARHGLGFFGILFPRCSGWILPFVVPIEVISQLARPFSLALRLFANMTAGHTILGVLFGFVIIMKFYIGWLPSASAFSSWRLNSLSPYSRLISSRCWLPST